MMKKFLAAGPLLLRSASAANGQPSCVYYRFELFDNSVRTLRDVTPTFTDIHRGFDRRDRRRRGQEISARVWQDMVIR